MEVCMRIRFGANFAVFVLFFGVSLLDAFGSGAWLRAGLWLLIGLVFLFADARPSRRED